MIDESARERFIEQFALIFATTYTANDYDRACFEGDHDRLRHSGIYEDGLCIAKDMWDHLKEETE